MCVCVCAHHAHEVAPVNAIKSIREVQREVHPVGVRLEERGDGVRDEVEAGAAGDAHLDRPRRAARLRRSAGLSASSSQVPLERFWTSLSTSTLPSDFT